MSVVSHRSREVAAAERVSDSPYKGQLSYQPEDADFFYGRDREAAHLTARILSARMTVLCAASGAGKTSLLNARIVPQLEAKGWTPIGARANENPIESVRVATLKHLFPPPAAEVEAIERVIETLGFTAETTIETLLEAFDRLPATVRRQLVMPVLTGVQDGPKALPPFGAVVPYFCRLLRRSIEISRLDSHLLAIEACTSGTAERLTEWTSIAQLLERLHSSAMRDGYRTMLSELYIPVPGLRPFFGNVFATYGAHVPSLAVVLVLDQFEELFTLFVDGKGRGSEAAHERDWQLRPQFLREIESLYAAPPRGSDAVTPPDLPIKIVISLREDYLAHLDPIRLFAPEINDTTYRLGMLHAEDARAAIREPAKHFGHSFPATLVDHVAREVSFENGRLIEPSRLQIVCDKLWKHRLAHEDEEEHARSWQALVAEPDWVRGVLDSFLVDALEEIARESVESGCFGELPDSEQARISARLELLHMLTLLKTSSHTRNIVEEATLVNAPFRHRAWRKDLLDRLDRRKLVRREQRLGGTFCEIAHEFLISGIEKAVEDEIKRDPDGYGRLGFGLGGLTAVDQGTAALLPIDAYRAVHANRARLSLPPWAIAVMFRSAVAHGDREGMAVWGCLYAAESPPAPGAIGDLLAGNRLLTLDELRLLYDHRDGLVWDTGTRKEQLTRVLRSAILGGSTADDDMIRYWTRELTYESA